MQIYFFTAEYPPDLETFKEALGDHSVGYEELVVKQAQLHLRDGTLHPIPDLDVLMKIDADIETIREIIDTQIDLHIIDRSIEAFNPNQPYAAWLDESGTPTHKEQ